MFRIPAAAAAAALALVAAAPNQAQAQVNTNCSGRVFIDTVYQNSTGQQNGQNRYEYILNLRNGTSAPIRWQLNFGALQGVTLFSPMLASGESKLAANSTIQIRFGNGTNGNVNSGTMRAVYDVAAGPGQVALTRCGP